MGKLSKDKKYDLIRDAVSSLTDNNILETMDKIVDIVNDRRKSNDGVRISIREDITENELVEFAKNHTGKYLKSYVTSKYVALERILFRDLQRGYYLDGDRFPSPEELCKHLKNCRFHENFVENRVYNNLYYGNARWGDVLGSRTPSKRRIDLKYTYEGEINYFVVDCEF